MAYAPLAAHPRELDYPQTAAPKAARRGLWRRLFDAMITARQRQAEREIAHYLHNIGGKFTDETEREIERFIYTRSR
jgi:hypothetical protein